MSDSADNVMTVDEVTPSTAESKAPVGVQFSGKPNSNTQSACSFSNLFHLALSRYCHLGFVYHSWN